MAVPGRHANRLGKQRHALEPECPAIEPVRHGFEHFCEAIETRMRRRGLPRLNFATKWAKRVKQEALSRKTSEEITGREGKTRILFKDLRAE